MEWNNVMQTSAMLKCVDKMEKAGVTVLEVRRSGSARIFEFLCTKCKEQWHITYDQINKGTNSEFYCPKCMKEKKAQRFNVQNLETLREEFKSKGAVLLNEGTINTHTILRFLCSNCGSEHSVKFGDYRRDRNPKLVCVNCSKHPKITIETVKKEFEEQGLTLLSKEYKNIEYPLNYICPECGQAAKITYNYFRQERSSYLCSKCYIHAKPTIKELRKYFKDRGAELVSDTYVDASSPLYFKCSLCGEEHYITYAKLGKKNKRLLCPKCMKGGLVKPEGSGSGKRSNIENTWKQWIMGFFNIVDSRLYSAHHILPYFAFPDVRLSIANGFPVDVNYHSVTYVDKNGISNPMHYRQVMLNPENWDEEIKLPYHNYSGFRFLNLNAVLQTDVIYKEMDKDFLLEKKKKVAEEGKVYLPFYVEEMIDPTKVQIIYSMIRNRLSKIYGEEIYQYTGQVYKKYHARKLKLEQLTNSQEQAFLRLVIFKVM